MIEIDGHKLSIKDTWNVSKGGIKVGLAKNAVKKMNASRALVDTLTAETRAIYGINTGFGPLSADRVRTNDIEKHQINLLHHLSCGQGALYSPEETRASMLARANALARGFSGIRPEVVNLLLGEINNDILPEIPSEGSVGASGDLVPLAHMARTLIGLGHVRINGKRHTTKSALKKAGLTPVVLKSKEGLALVNGTAIMTGIAALSVYESSQILDWMELLTSCLIQLMYGEPEILCEQIHKARGHRGQFVVAMRIAEHLKTHPKYKIEIEDHKWGSHAKPVEAGIEIQDPYSLRCAPQIIGAFQDALWHIEEIVRQELNATTDNPLIFPGSNSVIHGGNFYGQHISMVCDYLKNGLIKNAILIDRQIDRMVNWRYSLGLPRLLTGGAPGINTGFGGVQLLATSLACECRMHAMPASIQSIPTNANNQDVVSMGTISAKSTRSLLPLVWKLVGIEAMMLAQSADLRKDKNVMGERYKKLHGIIRSVTRKLENDRPLFEDIDAVVSLIQKPEVHKQLFKERPTNPLHIELGPID